MELGAPRAHVVAEVVGVLNGDHGVGQFSGEAHRSGEILVHLDGLRAVEVGVFEAFGVLVAVEHFEVVLTYFKLLVSRKLSHRSPSVGV